MPRNEQTADKKNRPFLVRTELRWRGGFLRYSGDDAVWLAIVFRRVHGGAVVDTGDWPRGALKDRYNSFRQAVNAAEKWAVKIGIPAAKAWRLKYGEDDVPF